MISMPRLSDSEITYRSRIHFISCGIFEPDLERVIDLIRLENTFDAELKVTYLGARLHTDFNLLGNDILKAIDSAKGDRIVLLYGSRCHPEFDSLLKNHSLIRFLQPNCIEIILRGKDREIFDYSKTFYLTPGWITKWREIFDSGFGPDKVMMRQSFSIYDRLLLGDTGVCQIGDEQVLELFEYTGVPIEIENAELDFFKENIINAIRSALDF